MRSNFMTKNHTHIYWDRSSDYVPLHQKDCQLSQFQCQQQSKSLLATWQLIIFGGFCKPNFQFTCNCCASTQKQIQKLRTSLDHHLEARVFQRDTVSQIKILQMVQSPQWQSTIGGSSRGWIWSWRRLMNLDG